MTTIELTNDEQELLGQIIQHSLATLEIEISHTDHKEFKDMLKQRRDMLSRVLAKLHAPVAVPA